MAVIATAYIALPDLKLLKVIAAVFGLNKCSNFFARQIFKLNTALFKIFYCIFWEDYCISTEQQCNIYER